MNLRRASLVVPAAACIAASAMLLLPATAVAQGENWYLRPTHIDSLPERVIPDTARGAPLEFDPGTCLGVFLDPGTGTRFVLQRDFMTGNGPIGDYALVPAGRYGVGPGVLIRMDCAIGRPLGGVPR
jgi:hypothetical protein